VFDHWEGINGSVEASSDTITVNLSNDLNVTAVFRPENETPDPEILYGDYNGDGAVNSTDLLACKRYLLYALKPEQINVIAGDLDGNGKINSTDYAYLKRYLLKQIDKFPYS